MCPDAGPTLTQVLASSGLDGSSDFRAPLGRELGGKIARFIRKNHFFDDELQDSFRKPKPQDLVAADGGARFVEHRRHLELKSFQGDGAQALRGERFDDDAGQHAIHSCLQAFLFAITDLCQNAD